jgi:hypothetical protein
VPATSGTEFEVSAGGVVTLSTFRFSSRKYLPMAFGACAAVMRTSAVNVVAVDASVVFPGDICAMAMCVEEKSVPVMAIFGWRFFTAVAISVTFLFSDW